MGSSRKKKPKTALQELFIKRVQEEMDAKGLSQNAVSSRVGGPPQKTFNDVMNGADPRLETVSQIAFALSVPVWRLMMERSDAAAQQSNVKQFGGPRETGAIHDGHIGEKLIDRKKRAR